MKRINIKIIAVLICCVGLLWACEREIELDLDYTEDLVVIDGSIFEGQPPTVIVKKVFPFQKEISIDDLANAYLDSANVTISVDDTTYQLTEISIDLSEITESGTGEFVAYFEFSGDLIGERGKAYHLNIELDGETYTSTAYLPLQTPLDSIWWEPGGISGRDELVKVRVHSSDADTMGNYYRIYTQRNSEPMYDAGLFDDKAINGLDYDVTVFRGESNYVAFNDDDYDLDAAGLFTKGDTVYAARAAITKDVYEFWSTLEYDNSSGGAFSATTSVKSNINGNNVLGCWAGYSMQERTIIIPE